MRALARKLALFGCRYVYAVAVSLYWLTFGILRAKHRKFLGEFCERFGFERWCPPPAPIPVCEARSLTPDDVPIEVHELAQDVGNVSVIELVVMAQLIRHHRPLRILEIGTFDGRTTLNFAANAPAEAVVYTLDLPSDGPRTTAAPLARGEDRLVEHGVTGRRFLGTPAQRKIVQLTGDSATFDFSPYVNTIDLVFVDGSHAYSYALNDSRIALRLLRAGTGIILWHDYRTWDGVTTALHELYRSDPACGTLRWIAGTSLVCLIR